MSTDYPRPTLHHKRAKSAVLSFMKRTPSEGTSLSKHSDDSTPKNYTDLPLLPNDHHHARALGELQYNQYNAPKMPEPRVETKSPYMDGGRSHKKTLSTISLKSLANFDTNKSSKVKEQRPDKPKKTKSSTNLASLLSRPKSSKSLRKQAQEEERLAAEKNKENQRPEPTQKATRPPPIYAQFSSEFFAKQESGGKFVEEEIDLYTPENYSPGKQRNFYAGANVFPSLAGPQRPKSTYLPSNFSLQDLTRKASNESRSSSELARQLTDARRPGSQRTNTGSSTQSEKPLPPRTRPVTTGPPVSMQRAPEPVKSNSASSDRAKLLTDQDVDKEFEAMLDRRNIPEHQRGKMRNLTMSMKRDFVRQDWAETEAASSGRPGTNGSNSSAEAAVVTEDIPEAKSKRPRSRTFTLSRKQSNEPTSPVKKSKGIPSFGRHSRTNSVESVKDGGKSLTFSGAAVAKDLVAKAKGQTTHDFVSYLKKNQRPETVEVGKLHKLRLLLRNETVAWTDDFIGQGGMEEIVGLLHRILAVEWREEHEDALLHEVLLCLKALSTTALAMKHLESFQSTLFPALIHMLFDEEKKGPSEFTTRHLVSWLLFAYLKMAPISERTQKAKTLLSYLRDPEPSESQRPVEFVLDMRRERPYRVWCKEESNVTKEVFWIFLHNFNVVPLPGQRDPDDEEAPQAGSSTIHSAISTPGFDITDLHHVYMIKNFPPELPPVPAAPYVGGVEWDATNYLTSHLDLINGIIACLPTLEERNTLRQQLLLSGWEKVMGSTLRLCKKKFYGGVHAALRTWVAAAHEDGWDTHDVRCGPRTEARSPVRKSPRKQAVVEVAPKIDMKLDFLGGGETKSVVNDDGWL